MANCTDTQIIRPSLELYNIIIIYMTVAVFLFRFLTPFTTVFVGVCDNYWCNANAIIVEYN